MATRIHRGIAGRQCSKQKCKCITPKYVSAYFTTKGDACIAVVCLCIQHMHQSPHIPSLIIQSNMCLCTAHVVSYTEAATSGRPTGHGPTSCTASLGGQPLVYSHVPRQCLHYPHIHCIICAYMGWAGGPVVYRFLYHIITAQLYIMKQDADEACAGHCQRRRWSPSPPRSRRAVLRPPPILCPTLCSGQAGGLHRCRLLLIECPVHCLHCLHIPHTTSIQFNY